MTAVWRLLGMSRASKTYGQYIQAFQTEGASRETARRIIQQEMKVNIPTHRFNTEWGIIKSAGGKWVVMNETTPGRIVRTGYQRTVFKQIQRYKTILKIQVVNDDTGELFDMKTTVYNDTLLKRKDIRELALEAIRKSSTTKLTFLDDELLAGYVSK